jgi:hypothetical protein
MLLAFLGLLALRLPFLPPTLDGLDSVNFDLGTHDFDPRAHQPHPPGYPLFIVAAKLTHSVFDSHGSALAAVSALFGAAVVVPLWLVMRAVSSPAAAVLATIVVVFNPLLWFTSVRPMSDMMGLWAVMSAQALLLGALHGAGGDSPGAGRRRLWMLGAFAAGLALGVRVQAIVLVGPLLAYGWWQCRAWRVATVVWFAGGVALWLGPVLVLSGGPIVLARAFIELLMDAVPVEPLVSRFTLDRARWAAHDAFLAGWGRMWLALTMSGLAVVGALALAWHDRRRLTLVVLLFGPYTVFHYALQMTEVVRYAIPIVPVIAVLAVEPVARWRVLIGLPIPLAAAAYVVAATAITMPALLAYRATPSPVSQALAKVGDVAGDGRGHLISGHFVFNRYLQGLQSPLRVIDPVPQTEWRRLADYWKNGGREPVLFLRDARRTSLALVGRRSQTSLAEWRWPESVRPFLKGSRPAWIELVRIDPPRWFAESGFFLTEEAGPLEQVAREPHRLYLAAADHPETIVVSGRVLGTEHAHVILRVAGRAVDRWLLNGQFTARARLDDVGGEGYVPVTIDATAPVLLTDLMVQPAGRGSVRPATGFFLPERDEGAKQFRWMGPEATAVVVRKDPGERVRLEGRVPVDYFRLPVTLTLALDDRRLGSIEITTRDFVVERELPWDPLREQSVLTLSVSQMFVPDSVEYNDDHRRLSLRVYDLSLVPFTTAGDRLRP